MIFVQSFHRRLAMTNFRWGIFGAHRVGSYPLHHFFFYTHELKIEPLITCLRGSSSLPLGPIYCWLFIASLLDQFFLTKLIKLLGSLGSLGSGNEPNVQEHKRL